MPDKEKSKLTELEMPSAVLREIGWQYMDLSDPLQYNVALSYLEETYRTRGEKWMRENVEIIRTQLDLLKSL